MDGLIHGNDASDFVYEVVSKYRNGYSILHQIKGTTKTPWVIRTPDSNVICFETENALWQYAIEKHLFTKRRRDKNG